MKDVLDKASSKEALFKSCPPHPAPGSVHIITISLKS